MTWSEKFISGLMIIVLFFVVFNIYVDFKDYFFTKDMGVFDIFFKNSIII